MGAWLGTNGKIEKITGRAGYGGVFTLTGRQHTAVQIRGGGQQEVEGGEGQASRMRHALPEAVIHLHTYYAIDVLAYMKVTNLAKKSVVASATVFYFPVEAVREARQLPPKVAKVQRQLWLDM